MDAALAGLGLKLHFGDRFERERTLSALHATPSEEAFAAAWAKGQVMTLDEAIADSLSGDEPQTEQWLGP